LCAPDRKLARVLVEVDIHNGLLETLEIQWRDQVIVQNLDYLGIPFRCSLCRRTGHLRSSCQGFAGVEEESESENSCLRKTQRIDSPEFYSNVREVPCPASSFSPIGTGCDTLTGKLKTHCPSFFNSLTTLENSLWISHFCQVLNLLLLLVAPTQNALRVLDLATGSVSFWEGVSYF
jgi:hypothetical protein